jgi:hypothetical protein
VLELPRGIWRWLAESSRNLGRIAAALVTIARELSGIRRTLQATDETKEDK